MTVVQHMTPETPNRTRQYRLSKQKHCKLDQVLESLASVSLPVEERKEVLSKSLYDQEEAVDVNFKISDSLLKYLKSLYVDKKYLKFYEI